MSDKQAAVIILVGIAFIAFLVIANVLENKSINGIKSKTVGDGQHGTARWATQREVKKTFSSLPYAPKYWRKGIALPTVQGTKAVESRAQVGFCRHISANTSLPSLDIHKVCLRSVA